MNLKAKLRDKKRKKYFRKAPRPAASQKPFKASIFEFLKKWKQRTKTALLKIMNGTAGERTAGSKPPAIAIRLGIAQTTSAAGKLTRYKAKIKTALTKGPLTHCKWIKNGRIAAISDSAKKPAAWLAFAPIFMLVLAINILIC
jgi:hypothetical protein